MIHNCMYVSVLLFVIKIKLFKFTSGQSGYLLLREKCKNDHEGIRTLNLLIRSQTPYPLGHAATF